MSRNTTVEVFVNADPEVHGLTTTDEVDHMVLRIHESVVQELGFTNEQVSITARNDLRFSCYYIHSNGGRPARLREVVDTTHRSLKGDA